MKIFAAKCFAHSGSPISLAEGNQIKAELSAIQSQVSSGLVIGNPALMFHLTSHTLTAPQAPANPPEKPQKAAHVPTQSRANVRAEFSTLFAA